MEEPEKSAEEPDPRNLRRTAQVDLVGVRIFMSDFQDNYFRRSTKSAQLQQALSKPYINLLRNQLDFTRVPFSDRGSRLLIYQTAFQCQFYVKLAERLTSIDPGIETYLHRPPFIHNLHLIDEEGELIEFEVTTYPHMLYLNTRLGEFGLLFTDNNTITFGIPPEVTAGISFHVSPQLWKTLDSGGNLNLYAILLIQPTVDNYAMKSCRKAVGTQ